MHVDLAFDWFREKRGIRRSGSIDRSKVREQFVPIRSSRCYVKLYIYIYLIVGSLKNVTAFLLKIFINSRFLGSQYARSSVTHSFDPNEISTSQARAYTFSPKFLTPSSHSLLYNKGLIAL